MTEQQKAICRELLAQSYAHGFDSSFPLAPIAARLGITEPLYDEHAGTGLLWDLGPYGQGLLDFSSDGLSAGVVSVTRDLLAHHCGFRG